MKDSYLIKVTEEGIKEIGNNVTVTFEKIDIKEVFYLGDMLSRKPLFMN